MRDNTGRFIATHNEAGTRLYNIWSDMKRRCYSKKRKDYPRYGGRGIIVCQEWKNSFIIFKNWALSSGYTDYLSIDRINNNGNYEPSNCQWITLGDNVAKSLTQPVLQYDRNSVLLARYHSIMDASRATSINSGGISNACCGRKPTAGGFIWRKENVICHI